MKKINIWDNIPLKKDFEPYMEYYPAKNKKTDACTIIFPGGGYEMRADHEGQGYAEFLNKAGMDAFVLQYRVYPDIYPAPILDARRAVRYVRHNAEKFGLDPKKISVMGSSAGGNLAALVSTFKGTFPYENYDDTDNEDPIPDFQILCYPVISLEDMTVTHLGSFINLFIPHDDFPGNIDGNNKLVKEAIEKYGSKVDPIKNVDKNTPPAFIWHTSNDNAVNVLNSLKYAEKLRENNVLFELHVYPDGPHGLGLAVDNKKYNIKADPYVGKWADNLLCWFKLNKLL